MEHYRYYCISITWSEEEWNYHKPSHWKWDYWSYTFWKIYIRIIGAKEKIWVKYKTFQEAINVTVFSPLRQFKIWKSVITILKKDRLHGSNCLFILVCANCKENVSQILHNDKRNRGIERTVHFIDRNKCFPQYSTFLKSNRKSNTKISNMKWIEMQ